MTGVFFEDFAPGQVIEGGPITVTQGELVAFAREFDPQPFHLDEAAARNTFVGRLIGSGWQTACIGMRLLHRDAFRGQTSMGSPGIEELRWLRPVLPNDRLRSRITVAATRPSASKPDRGFVRFAMSVLNGSGAEVMTQNFSVIFARRDAVALPPRPVERVHASAPAADPVKAELLKPLSLLPVGTVREIGQHRFEADAIVAFARLYDPQAMHTDPEAARDTHFGALCASGWHTAAIWMKQITEGWARDLALTTERGECAPQLGPSPGFKGLRWLKPVYRGDTLRYATRLVDKRESRTRPGWGIATHHNTAENQAGECVFEFTGSVFRQWSL